MPFDASRDDPSSRTGVVTRHLRPVALGVALALLAVYGWSVGTRYLINDDYQTLYTAWLQSIGKVPGRDYYLTSYYLLVDLLAPLFKVAKETWFPVYASRVVMLAVLGGNLVLLVRLARRLFNDNSPWLVPVVLLSSTTMLHRGLDIRPDLITNLFWLAILLVLESPSGLAPRRVLLAGAMLVLVILNRFKGALILPLVLVLQGHDLWLMGPSGWRRAPRVVLGLVLGGLAVLVPYLLWITATGDFRVFLDVQRALFADLSRAGASPNGVLGRTFARSFTVDYPFWFLAIFGVGLRLSRWRAHAPKPNLMVLGLLVTAALTVVLNPAYYAYNLVTLQALLAPFAASALLRLAEAVLSAPWPALLRPAALTVMVLLPAAWNLGPLYEVVSDSNSHQKGLHNFLVEFTRPHDRVFALEGVGLWRPSLFHWRFPAVLSHRYSRGDWSYVQELKETPAELILVSYRVPGWLTRRDVAFIADHYVPLTPLVLVPGFDSKGSGPSHKVDLLVAGSYEIFVAGPDQCVLDETPVTSGEVRTLAAGIHHLKSGGSRCVIRRHYAPQAIALLGNSFGRPYFTPPELDLPSQVCPGY